MPTLYTGTSGFAFNEWKGAFYLVFFKHEDEGAGPELARRFEKLFARGVAASGAAPSRHRLARR